MQELDSQHVLNQIDSKSGFEIPSKLPSGHANPNPTCTTVSNVFSIRWTRFLFAQFCVAVLAANLTIAQESKKEAKGDPPKAGKQAEPENGGKADAEKADAGKAAGNVNRGGFLVRIPMPVTGDVANRVVASIDRAVEKTGNFSGQRPLLILEFDNRTGTNGVGSSFADCLKIAQHLTSQNVSKVRTVAYLPGVPPGTKGLFDDGSADVAEFVGHMVLIALSCEEIVMHQEAAIGKAGIDVEVIDEVTRTAYSSIAAKRSRIPVPVAISMLDKSTSVIRVELRDDGVRYVEEKEFDELEAAGKVVSSQTIADIGNFGFFSSQDLQSYRLITHRVESRRDLADRFNLPRTALEGDPSLGKEWNAVRIQVNGVIGDRMVTWIENALNTRVDRDKLNLVIVEIESSGGEPQAVVRLANLLSEYDPSKVRTVAYVADRAKGAASVVAWGCDHLVMRESAIIGGEGRPTLKPEQLFALKESLKDLSQKKETSWSLWYGLLDPSFEVKRFKHKRTGRIRLLSDEEQSILKDADQWQELQTIDTASGLDGATAEEFNIVRSLVEDFEEFKSFYQLESDPQTLEPTLADRWVEKLAHQLASPRIAWLVLFFGIFFLSMEMSNPGLGIPGFLSATCWMLFFWSQYFDGNASVLEIMLFIVGAIFVVIELFVIPGFGIFGIGGALMITVSIILAVQTFVIPSNSEEVSKMTTSLLTFLGATSGFFVALFVFRKYMTRLPFIKRLSLQAELDEVDQENRAIKESLVDYAHLVGKSGLAQTKLMPSGKALINNELFNVITDGRMIDKNAEIVVQSVSGNKIEVGLKS